MTEDHHDYLSLLRACVCFQHMVKLEVKGLRPVETILELHRDVDWEPGGFLILVYKRAAFWNLEKKT